eukprot:gene8457-9150_t
MSRSNALANDASHRFIDPISLDLMKDPVLAADGHFYDRETITTWFATLRAQGRQITSPRTNLPLQDEILTPNTALKRDLDIFIASMSTILPADIQFTLSSEIFKELDRISSMSEMSLLDFQAPKIVVLGNESHGKSMILERVIGLPLFPKEKGICTRCVVRVHMRRSVADEPSLAEIYVQKVFVGGKITHRNESSPAPEIVALDNIREKIKEAMDDLVRNDPQQRMVVDDHEIIVKITLPYCLNVDILDLPGLVTTSPPSTTQNLPQVTKEIAMRIIREQKESSLFVLVNDVRVPPNQSRGCEVVQETKIEGQTLGIFTKVDTFVSEDGSEAAELQQLLNSGGGAFPLGYGWMAAASRSVNVAGITNKLQAFQLIEQNESRFFQETYAPLITLNKLGIQKIRKRIQVLYESFVQNHWIPVILTKLNANISRLEKQICDLGTPLPPDNDYIGFIEDWGEKMRINLPTLTEEKVRQFFKDVLDRLFMNCERKLICLKEDEGFWDLMNYYHSFIGEEDEKVAYNEYTNCSLKRLSHDHSKATPEGQPTPSAFSHGSPDKSLQGRRKLRIVHPRKASAKAPPQTQSAPSAFIFNSAAPAKAPPQTQSAPSAFIFNSAAPAKAPPQTQSAPSAFIFKSAAPPLSETNVTQFQPAFSFATFKFDTETFNRDIPAFEANVAFEALETKFKESLYLFYNRLHDRINPDATFILSTRNFIVKVAAKEDPLFKLERFDVLLAALVQVVESQFNKIVQLFDDWFGQFIASVYEKPLLHSVYYREDTIRCKLYWSQPYELHKYPHMILDKFYQCLRENLKSPIDLPTIDIASLQEGCKNDRLHCFEEMKKMYEVKEAVVEFANKVQNEMEAIKHEKH